MKKRGLTVFALAAVLAVGTATITSQAAEGWSRENNTWVYYDSQGYLVRDEWKKGADNQWRYLNGSGVMAVNEWVDDTYYVDGDGRMIANSWLRIASDDEEAVDGYLWYYFNSSGKAETDGWKKNALSDLFFSNPAWFGQDRQNLLPLLQQIFRELEEKRLGYAGQISALLAQCMIALVRNYEMALQPESCKKGTGKASASPLSDKAMLVERYFLYEYEHLSLEELAEQLGFSVRQTQRFLQEHYGKTFREKKEESRMAAALLLLSASGESVTSISEKLGFASVEYFSSCFKKFHGRTPRDYRKSLGQ